MGHIKPTVDIRRLAQTDKSNYHRIEVQTTSVQTMINLKRFRSGWPSITGAQLRNRLERGR